MFALAVQTSFASDTTILVKPINQANKTNQSSVAEQNQNGSAFLKVPKLTNNELDWIGQRIYQNECASNPKYLTYWGKGEAFPSFGIGHFIWYPGLVKGKFHETFPAMVKFVSHYKTPPKWLNELDPFIAPWQNKNDFYQAWSNKKLHDLRLWLLNTQGYQAEFIAQQAKSRLTDSLNALSLKQPKKAMLYKQRINKLLSFKEGRFAVIDYINFKGVGANSEQYQGEQWGLFSVLQNMPLPKKNLNEMSHHVVLDAFIQSAKARLQLRVKLAPKQRNEQRWLAGWLQRLDGYRQ
ncbi:hypothetical protein JCM30760_12820 [Thiomicrorhabdus hydrogeniphila]